MKIPTLHVHEMKKSVFIVGFMADLKKVGKKQNNFL
jgi:hypothetical protein